MPKLKEQIQSPPRPQRSGSKHLAENLSKDELLRRLKKIAQELSDVEQGENLDDYLGTVTVLARTFIIKHADKDVRFNAACCLAHVLRIFAPEPPYDRNQLWSIFDLIISQLEGLKYAKSKEKGTSNERLFHLLEALAVVKTLILCVQLEFTDLTLKFFRIMFSCVRDEHSKKVKNFMLDIMSALLVEVETVPQDLLHIILDSIIDAKKNSDRAVYELASTLIERTSSAIEPYVLQFFNSALFAENSSESVHEDKLYDILYELYKICPGILLSILPQLEFKLKSVDKNERIQVVQLLGKMFSDKESTLAKSHKPLWHCFVGRFVDIEYEVRVHCVQYTKFFLLYHPELVGEITDKLVSRQRDPEQRVRMEVVTAICEVASEDINKVSQELFDVVTERLRDRKLDVRKDSMMALGRLYKKMSASDVSIDNRKKVSWVPSKILHSYFRDSLEDRIHVERVFLSCLVPVSLRSQERMQRLFTLYQSLDEPGVRVFNHMLKTQARIRSDLNDILALWEKHQTENSDETKKTLSVKIAAVSRLFPDHVKSQEHLRTLVNMLSEKKLLALMKICLGSGQDCAKVSEAVKEVVIKIGAKNPMYETVKTVLDRAAQLLIDKSSGKELVILVDKCVKNELFDCDILSEEDSETFDEENELSLSGHKALELLLTCVTVFPTEFKFPLLYENLLTYLKKKDILVDYALRILTHISESLQETDPTLYSHYQPVLVKIFSKAKPSHVKLAGNIVAKAFSSSSSIFKRILESRKDSLDYGSTSILNTLCCINQIALHAPDVFDPYHATIIRDFVVKELLVKDRGKVASRSGPLWCDEDDLSKETKAKVFGLKILVNWLRGKSLSDKGNLQLVVDMLSKAITLKGDINGGGRIRPCEMSRIRLVAASGLLKLAQIPHYHQYFDMKCFQDLTFLPKDTCNQVRETFAAKLSKGLDSLKLPLEYLALFSFYGRDTPKDLKQKVKQMILRNVNIRNEYSKQQKRSPERSASILPEYAMPYLIYILSHLPNFDYTKSDNLRQIKEYLWFFMECILARGEKYNFVRKLAQNIKQTKDANTEEPEETNNAIYAVCDIVIGIIIGLSKTRKFEDYSAGIVLPKKLFVSLGKGKSNDKSYLPKDFHLSPVKKTANIVSKITPTKSVSKITPSKSGSKSKSDSTDKKKTAEKPSSSDKQLKSKKIQRSLLSMLNKKDDDSDIEESSDVDEEEIPTRKDASNEVTEDDEDSEETFTKVSPRKKAKTSTEEEKTTRQNTRSSTKDTTKSSSTRVSSTKKRQAAGESNSSQKEKQIQKSPSKGMKVEKQTRFSPRRNPRSATEAKRKSNLDVDEGNYLDKNSKTPIDKRTKNLCEQIEVNGTSQQRSDDSQTDSVAPSPTKSPERKRKIVEHNNHENPKEQTSLVVKRKRNRR